MTRWYHAPGMTVILPDGSRLELPDGATGHDAAAAIGPGLAKAAVAVRVGDEVRDLARPLADGDAIAIVTPKSGDDYLYVMRHSAAHVMAEAVQALVPGTKLGFGPPIEDGFYYDFDLPRPLTEDDFPAIEAEMARIVAAKAPFQRSVMSVADAREHFAERGDPYKVDQIDELARQGETSVSLYRQRDFVDLCRGPAPAGHRPHRPRQAAVGRGRLLAGQRAEPPAHPRLRHRLPDRRRSSRPTSRPSSRPARATTGGWGASSGSSTSTTPARASRSSCPKGMVVVNGITDAVRADLDRMGYDEIQTPTLLTDELWHRSGHWDHYREHMYFTDGRRGHGFALKPMNCPGACLVYRSRRRSYRDLPIRYAEFGHVHRHELSGVLHGLFRVRAFTQDDAHIFCRLDQVHGGGALGARRHPRASTRASASAT